MNYQLIRRITRSNGDIISIYADPVRTAIKVTSEQGDDAAELRYTLAIGQRGKTWLAEQGTPYQEMRLERVDD